MPEKALTVGMYFFNLCARAGIACLYHISNDILKTSMEETSDTSNQYLPELYKLRKRLMSVIIVFLVGLVIGFIFNQQLLMFAIKVFNFSGVNIVFTSPGQLLELAFYTALLTGGLLALPVLGYQSFMYVKPALKEKEYRLLKSFVPLSIVLFVVGAAFGVWINQLIITVSSKLSSNFHVSNIWDIQRFFSQVIMTAVLTGLIFQMPLVLSGLIRFKLMSRKYLASKRPYVYAVLLIIAVLLPTTDVLSLILLTMPLILLFEVALLININQA